MFSMLGEYLFVPIQQGRASITAERLKYHYIVFRKIRVTREIGRNEVS